MTESPGAESTESRPTVAAVDLGSNSFHMIIARSLEHDLHVLDRMRDPVRLADGLDKDGRIADDAQERALASLERFGERIRNLPSVRAGSRDEHASPRSQCPVSSAPKPRRCWVIRSR